jgi:alkanesulfonate monooxygenase SsuD/methylene tetrahydromethanopterin reductase-like flavin-dependent oxidoreductase (luciferase family)
LQVRGDDLLVFPRGKSAMILYAASAAGETLHDFVRARGATALERAATLAACWVRFGESPTPEAALARLLDQFCERFGGPPPANS